jgi:hypothetical protein
VGQRPSLNQTEPVIIRTVVLAIIQLVGLFGLKMATEDQDDLIDAAIVLVPLLLAAYAWWTRRNVYAPATVRDVQAEAFKDGIEVAANNGGGVGGVASAVPGVVPGAVATAKIANGAVYDWQIAGNGGRRPKSLD